MTNATRSILAATDLSEGSADVVRAAAELSALTGAELHLIHAVVPSRGAGGDDVLPMQRRIHDARFALRAEVDAVAPPGTRVGTIYVADGRADRAILERAVEVDADLIVVGPHRTRAFGDQILGTTADQLVREGTVPCLVVRGPLQAPIRRVVVPSDLSEVARGALAVALRWTEALQDPSESGSRAELTVVHVNSDPVRDGSAPGEALDGWPEQERQMGDPSGAAGHSSTVGVDRQFLRGDSPADEILRFARDRDADLLVMGTRGDRPLVKAMLGSVSAAVARATEIPLLLVPPAVSSASLDRPEVEEPDGQLAGMPPAQG